MEYIQVTVNACDPEIQAIMIAFLSELGFETFQENDTELLAYIDLKLFDKEKLITFLTFQKK